jgi:signal transduction histidine kinase
MDCRRRIHHCLHRRCKPPMQVMLTRAPALDDALLASRAGAGELAEELVELADVARAEVEDRRSAGKPADLRLGGAPANGTRLGGSAASASNVEPAGHNGPVVVLNTTVLGDRLALRRVIANLVDNALLYGKAAHVSIDADREFVTMLVDDDGAGIPPDRRETVLQPFVRLEDSRNRSTGGAGLGLAIARSFVEAHGGTISINDSPSGGARLTVRLPLFVPR